VGFYTELCLAIAGSVRRRRGVSTRRRLPGTRRALRDHPKVAPSVPANPPVDVNGSRPVLNMPSSDALRRPAGPRLPVFPFHPSDSRPLPRPKTWPESSPAAPRNARHPEGLRRAPAPDLVSNAMSKLMVNSGLAKNGCTRNSRFFRSLRFHLPLAVLRVAGFRFARPLLKLNQRGALFEPRS
jgi:hypothetical protein